MSVFISDKDKAKLYVQFLTPKQPQIKILVLEWVDLYQRFWSLSKNLQPNEICSHLSEKASKGTLLKPEKLQNHSNERKGKEKKKERGEGKEEKKKKQ